MTAEMVDLARESIWEIAALARLIPDQLTIGNHYAGRGMVDRILRLADVIETLLARDPKSDDELAAMHQLVWLERRTEDNHA